MGKDYCIPANRRRFRLCIASLRETSQTTGSSIEAHRHTARLKTPVSWSCTCTHARCRQYCVACSGSVVVQCPTKPDAGLGKVQQHANVPPQITAQKEPWRCGSLKTTQYSRPLLLEAARPHRDDEICSSSVSPSLPWPTLMSPRRARQRTEVRRAREDDSNRRVAC